MWSHHNVLVSVCALASRISMVSSHPSIFSYIFLFLSCVCLSASDTAESLDPSVQETQREEKDEGQIAGCVDTKTQSYPLVWYPCPLSQHTGAYQNGQPGISERPETSEISPDCFSTALHQPWVLHERWKHGRKLQVMAKQRSGEFTLQLFIPQHLLVSAEK